MCCIIFLFIELYKPFRHNKAVIHEGDMQNTSFKMLGWMNHNLESTLQEEISTTSDMHDTTLMAESEEGPLDESERGE